jgi:serine/threonine protein kinase/Tol biopolymer transport system component
LIAGTKVGRYEIRSKIGEGGMGEVYLAHDTELDRPVAIKVLSAEVAADPRRMQRFTQEARAASALNHPNILTIYEIVQTDSVRFFVSEFVDGITLRERMDRTAKLTEVLDITIQIARALVAAHAAGIVHRDIKPENVMIRGDGYVKVLDFGLAKLIERGTPSVDQEAATRALVNTDPGSVMGTVNYMSPEQAAGKQLDARTDVWSLGIVLFEMLTSTVPFHGNSPSHTIVAILDHQPPPLTSYLTDVPEALQEIVTDALAKDPEERFQTARQMLAKLQRLKQRVDAGASLEYSLAPDRTSQSSGEMISRGVHPTLILGQTTARSGEAPTVAKLSGLQSAVPIRKRSKTLAIVAGLVLLALVAIGLGYYRVIRDKFVDPLGPGAAMSIRPLTDTGKARDAVVSADGRLVAYVLEDGDQTSIHLRQVTEASDKEIVPPTPGQFYFGPTFSPDGNYLTYLGGAGGENLHDLFRVPVLGGVARKLNHDVDSPVSFAAGGKQFAFMRVNPTAKTTAIIISSAEGGAERELASLKSPESIRDVAWSPDGETIAYVFFGTDNDGYYAHVGEARVDNGRQSVISAARWRQIVGLVWLPDKSGLIIGARDRASAPSTPPQIWLLPYPAGEPRKLTNDLNSYDSVSLAADGKTLVATKVDFGANIWVGPANDSMRARQVTASSENGIGGCSWTPDGRLVYSSRASGYLDLWIMNADGSGARQLTFGTDANDLPTVSSDGRYIVFETNRSVGWSIWRMNLDGSGPKELVRNIDQSAMPQTSADGQWVFYTSRESTGKPVVWRVSIDGGTPQQLTQNEGSSALLSPDGRMFARYTRETPEAGVRIEVSSVSGGEPVKQIDSPANSYNVNWMPGGQALAVVKDANKVSNLWRLPLDGGKSQQLTDWKTDRIFWFSWSRDGKQLAVSRGHASHDVLLIKDFK